MKPDDHMKLTRNARLFLLIYEAALLVLSLLLGAITVQVPMVVLALALLAPCIVLPPWQYRLACSGESPGALVRFWVVLELCVMALLTASVCGLFVFSLEGLVARIVTTPVLLLEAVIVQLAPLIVSLRNRTDCPDRLGEGAWAFLTAYYIIAGVGLVLWSIQSKYNVTILFVAFRVTLAVLIFPLCIVLPPLYYRRAQRSGNQEVQLRFWAVLEICVMSLFALVLVSCYALCGGDDEFGIGEVFTQILLGGEVWPVLLAEALLLQSSALVAYFRETRKNQQYLAPPEDGPSPVPPEETN